MFDLYIYADIQMVPTSNVQGTSTTLSGSTNSHDQTAPAEVEPTDLSSDSNTEWTLSTAAPTNESITQSNGPSKYALL